MSINIKNVTINIKGSDTESAIESISKMVNEEGIELISAKSKQARALMSEEKLVGELFNDFLQAAFELAYALNTDEIEYTDSWQEIWAAVDLNGQLHFYNGKPEFSEQDGEFINDLSNGDCLESQGDFLVLDCGFLPLLEYSDFKDVIREPLRVK